MSLSERNTPSHGQGTGSGGGTGTGTGTGTGGTTHRQRPPDVEEALSSMLWTPYERTPLPSSEEEAEEEEDDDERLNRKLRKSHSSYEASSLSAGLALSHHPSHQGALTQHHLPLFGHHHHHNHQQLQQDLLLALPPCPVPSFPPFSLRAFDEAIAGFDHLAKGGGFPGGRRNRYSFPSYQGSPSRTLTQWCSSAATSIKEPPSYESLYSAGPAAPPATSSSLLARASAEVAHEPCDRSQRSPKKSAAVEEDRNRDGDQDQDRAEVVSKAAILTANVPAGLGLKRSFTDDYISQNCASFTPATTTAAATAVEIATKHSSSSNTEKATTETNRETATQSKATNAGSQQSEENCIINEQSDDETATTAAATPATPATTPATAAAAAEESSRGNEETSSVAVQVTQPVSCARREQRAAGRALAAPATLGWESNFSSNTSSSASNIGDEHSTISFSATFDAAATNADCYSRSSGNYGGYRSVYDSKSVLRPNKCLAELERLYAEFRASESRFERGLSQLDIENANEMRLNVPATAAAAATVASSNGNSSSSSSSVFLNSDEAKSISNIAVLPAAKETAAAGTTATTTSKSCQRQPSLTIQVNNNNNNNGNTTNGTNNGNRVSVASSPTSIVNNNNGVCVVNCSYTPSSSSSSSNTSNTSNTGNNANNNNNNNNSVVEINNKVFSASVQNKLNNNNNNNNGSVQADNSVNIINVNASSSNNSNPRTFTSTECQTDDLTASSSRDSQQQQEQQQQQQEQLQQQQQQIRTREQRRRERRERRQQQQQQQQFPPHHPRRHHATTAAVQQQHAAHAAHAAPPQPPALTSVISTVPLPGPLPAPLMNDGRFTLPLPIMRRSPSERSGKGCCGQWFAGPPLRALIAVVALGGVACALGGAALGATGLAGPPNSHLTAALLMIGVGVVLVTVSGAAWRMTAPGGQSCLGIGLGTSVDLGRCGRRPCSRGGGAPHGLLYPEFQHRPPPPSYQASMQEYRLRLLLLDRDRQNGVVRGNSPPPTYRSHAGSLLRAPLTTLRSGMGGGGGGGGSAAGGTISSSMGGSEYSLPPSYRSRNATPASLVCGERNIETAPSGRLLANEDVHLPEPSVAEQLPDYTALQSNTLLTSAIVEIESSNRVAERERESQPAKSKSKDLVTIVTISQSPGGSHSHSHSQTQTQTQTPSGLDQIDILAHL
ncbi:hypothetical protein KR038_011716 [Drosophila bunnanda]|nr:hypothetical protein KR038_011716 [Drosophila bunnanda]